MDDVACVSSGIACLLQFNCMMQNWYLSWLGGLELGYQSLLISYVDRMEVMSLEIYLGERILIFKNIIKPTCTYAQSPPPACLWQETSQVQSPPQGAASLPGQLEDGPWVHEDPWYQSEGDRASRWAGWVYTTNVWYYVSIEKGRLEDLNLTLDLYVSYLALNTSQGILVLLSLPIITLTRYWNKCGQTIIRLIMGDLQDLFECNP